MERDEEVRRGKEVRRGRSDEEREIRPVAEGGVEGEEKKEGRRERGREGEAFKASFYIYSN